MDIKKIKKILNKYILQLRFSGRYSYSKMYNHWGVVLIVFFIFNIILLIFSLYLFLQINEGGIFLVEQKQEIQIKTIDRGALKELLASFNSKDVLFKNRTVSAPRISNPSR